MEPAEWRQVPFGVLLAKKGYKLPGVPDQSGADGLGWMGGTTALVEADTHFDIEIVPK